MNTEQHSFLGMYSGNAKSARDHQRHGNVPSEMTSRILYDQSYQTLREADFMAVHTSKSPSSESVQTINNVLVNSLKVIIILSLMAHSFE